jgi:SAM-dependent methyltransferase
MSDTTTRLAGEIPAHYHYLLGPLFFAPYAVDLARRVRRLDPNDVLELGAGTGILTRHLLDVVHRTAQIVATDGSDAMLDMARRRLGADPRVEFQTVDPTSLPFEPAAFDVVVCQLELMIPADKPAALREARRVLRRGGTLLFSTWATLAENPIARIAHDEVASFFHTDPPSFLTEAFGLHDVDAVRAMLFEAGFAQVEHDVVDLKGTSESAAAAGKGLVFGSPLLAQIRERGMADPTPVAHAIATRLSEAGGAAPMRLPMRAHVFSAR